MAVTIIQDEAGRQYALGLEWKRIVAAGSGETHEANGYSIAHKAGSNRLTFTRDSRGEVRGVGHGRFAKSEFNALALAQALVLRHDQKDRLVAAITLAPGSVWVCAVSEGMVVNGLDFVGSEAEASARIRDLGKRFAEGALLRYGDFFTDGQVLTLDELQETASQHSEDCSLLPTRKNQESLRKVAVILTCLGLVLSAKYGYDYYKRYKAEQAAKAAEAAAVPTISAQEAWDRGIATWVEKSSQASPMALQQLLSGLSSLPIQIDGWEIKTVDCTRAARRWGCVAGFEREVVTRSTTEAFLRGLPPGWEADWGPMNKVSARFGFDADANKVVVANLQDSKKALLPLLAHLQANSRAFQKAEIGPAAAIPMELPKKPDGTPIVVDPTTVKPVIVSMEVTAAGPLRSFYTLVEQPVSWKLLRLSITKNVQPDSPEKSVVNVVDAKGDVYAIK